MRLVLSLLLAAAASLPLASSWAGPYEDGVSAYERKDYATALRLWRPLAAQGDASAQFLLGVMYLEGLGVVEDLAEAAKWLRLAAAQGDASAQYNLGLMYAKGEGVVQDYVRAHAWLNLAAERGNANAVKGRDTAATLMTAQQIAEAQKLARECQARNFKECD